MERNELFQIAEEKGHRIVYFPLPVNKSVSIPLADTCVVGLDPSLTERELKTCLAHELGHCEYGGFYCRDVPLEVLGRREYRANIWAARRILPFPDLKKAVHCGITEPWELAEYFNTTEEMVRFALTYYIERRGYEL